MSNPEDGIVLSDEEDFTMLEDELDDPEARMAAARQWQREQMEEDDQYDSFMKPSLKGASIPQNTTTRNEESLQSDFAPPQYEIGPNLDSSSSNVKEILFPEKKQIPSRETTTESAKSPEQKRSTPVQQENRPIPTYVPRAQWYKPQKTNYSSVEEIPRSNLITNTEGAPSKDVDHEHQRSIVVNKAPSALLGKKTNQASSNSEIKSQHWNAAKEKPVFHYSLDTVKQLGPDDGSMDAFIDTDFVSGQPIVTPNRGNPPIARTYDSNIKGAKRVKWVGNRVKAPNARSDTPKSPEFPRKIATELHRMGSRDSARESAKQKTDRSSLQRLHPDVSTSNVFARSPSKNQVPRQEIGEGWAARKETSRTSGFENLSEKKKGSSAGGKVEETTPKTVCVIRVDEDKALLSSSSVEIHSHKKLAPRYKAPSIKLTTAKPSRKPSTAAKHQNEIPTHVSAVLKGNRKCTLGEVPVGTLFNPTQIISKEERECTKRQRIASKSQRDVQDTANEVDQTVDYESIPGDDPTAAASPAPSYSSLFVDDNDRVVATEGTKNKYLEQYDNAHPAHSDPVLPSPPPSQTPDEMPQQMYEEMQENSTSQPPRPTLARKTISPQMLARLEAAAAVTASSPNLDDVSKDDLDPIEPRIKDAEVLLAPAEEILYQFPVTRYDFGPKVPEDAAVMTVFGPFYSRAEANERARREAGRSYAEMFVAEQKEGRRRYLGQEKGTGSEVAVGTDAVGCQTWRCASVGGLGVVAAVSREIAPKTQYKASIPNSAFRIPRHMYVAMQFFRPDPVVAEPDDDGGLEQSEGEFVMLGAFTEPDLANKCAGDAVVRFQARDLGNTVSDQYKCFDLEMEMRRRRVELDNAEELFDEQVEREHGEIGRVWVMVVVVQGPRN